MWKTTPRSSLSYALRCLRTTACSKVSSLPLTTVNKKRLPPEAIMGRILRTRERMTKKERTQRCL